jgi:hypothetical protein
MRVGEGAAPIAIRLQPRGRRLARSFLFGVSRIGLWWVLAVVLVSTDPPVTPPILFRLTLVLIVLPGLAAAVLRGRPTTAEVDGDTLVVRQGRKDLQVPGQAIAAIRTSRVPFPDVAVAVLMRSGRRLVPDFEVDDPEPLIDALARGGAPIGDTRSRPGLTYATARARFPRRFWDRPPFKYGVFPMLPAAILFRAHQYITHGGLFGEYYTYGAAAWLTTLATYWAATVVYCLLWASVWRGAGEAVALGATAAAPARAARVRRLVEAACRLGYYGGIPILLLLRFR